MSPLPPPRAPPHAVLLDATGTLIGLSRPLGETYARAARDAGARFEPRVLEDRFRRAFADTPPMAFPGRRGADLDRAERGWWRAVVERVTGGERALDDFDAYFNRLYSHYAEAEGWRVYPEVPAVLEALRARGVALAVVSNFDSRLGPLLAGLGIASFFDALVCSGEVGVAKPDRAIFAHALSALGVEASEALHVGDSRRNDYDGACAAGIDALLVHRGAGAASPDTIPDLRGILDRW